MVEKTLFLLAAGVGLVLLAALVLAGTNAQQATRSGPNWRRRLVCAALFLLGCLSCSSGEAGPPPKVAGPEAAGQSLEETPHWKYIASVWAEAEAVGSGKRGDYPFDEKGKKALLASLEEAIAKVGKLKAGGALSAPEAELLTSGLQLLGKGVQAKRPTEMQNATCYRGMVFTLEYDSLKRLRTRLLLLQKQVDEKSIPRAALEQVLPSIEADLKTLTSPEEVKRLDPGRRAEAEQIRKEGQAALSAIRKLLEAKK